MKLDNRILEGKRPLMCFDTEEASKFVNEKGYFSDCLYNFQNLDNCSKSILHCIDDKREDSNDYIFNDGKYYCRFFLPEAYVIPEEPEKKYRAFTNIEFVDLFDSGKLRSIRLKDNSTKRLERLIITDIYVQGDYLYAKLNSSDTGYGPAYFFSKCEYFDGKEWQPFGVIDEEGARQ